MTADAPLPDADDAITVDETVAQLLRKIGALLAAQICKIEMQQAMNDFRGRIAELEAERGIQALKH